VGFASGIDPPELQFHLGEEPESRNEVRVELERSLVVLDCTGEFPTTKVDPS
jgi:hypothetical protein